MVRIPIQSFAKRLIIQKHTAGYFTIVKWSFLSLNHTSFRLSFEHQSMPSPDFDRSTVTVVRVTASRDSIGC